MSNHQTENSFFEIKVNLRLENLPDKPLKVLDCFSADGKIWKEIAKHRENLNILRIEKENNKDGIYLRGDNLKFLSSLDLNQFDVIDLDAFGIPFKQLRIIFQKVKTDKIIFVTFIQSLFGTLPKQMLNDLGYTKQMINKIPTLFNHNGFNKFCCWLFLNKIDKIKFYNLQNKYYITFNLNGGKP